MFLVLIGDIDTAVANSFVSSFADDTTISKAISTEDVNILQEDVRAIYNWAEQNNMEFNCTKFENIRYGADVTLKQQTYQSPMGETIEQKESVRDLGVTMSSDGTFKNHIENVTLSAKKLSGWILRTFKT